MTKNLDEVIFFLLYEIFKQRFSSRLNDAHLNSNVILVVEADLLQTVTQILHFSLQLGLNILEQVFLLFVLTVEIVGVRIGVLESVSSACQDLDGLDEKLPIDECPTAAPCHDLLVDFERALLSQSFLEFQAVRVVYPPVVVVRVAVECLACVVLLRVAFVPVAVVRGTVGFPIIRTNPAEFVFASIASHVRTAAVLFDAHLALGTVLGVHEQVVARLRVVLTLDVPLVNGLARVGRVIRQLTLETIRVLTRRAHDSTRRWFTLAPNYVRTF